LLLIAGSLLIGAVLGAAALAWWAIVPIVTLAP
jgi:hypothetical protein